MRVQVWAWKCEVVTCGHVWLASDVIPPPQCAKCKSRRWHSKLRVTDCGIPSELYPGRLDGPEHIEARQEMVQILASKPEIECGSVAQQLSSVNMEALRAICAGQFSQKEPVFDNPLTRKQVDSQINRVQQEAREIPICGKDWWEDGEHHECLMDKGHRESKHGMRGMVRVLS